MIETFRVKGVDVFSRVIIIDAISHTCREYSTTCVLRIYSRTVCRLRVITTITTTTSPTITVITITPTKITTYPKKETMKEDGYLFTRVQVEDIRLYELSFYLTFNFVHRSFSVKIHNVPIVNGRKFEQFSITRRMSEVRLTRLQIEDGSFFDEFSLKIKEEKRSRGEWRRNFLFV